MPRKKKYDRVGRPPNHPMVKIVELDEVYPTFEAVAKRIDGDRSAVFKCIYGERHSHKGYTFEWVDGPPTPENPLHCNRRKGRGLKWQ